MYILQNDHHNNFSQHPSPRIVTLFFLVMRLTHFMLEEWERGRQNWLIYMQIYLDQNMVEMLITITFFVSAIYHMVTLSIYSYLLLLPIPYFFALGKHLG